MVTERGRRVFVLMLFVIAAFPPAAAAAGDALPAVLDRIVDNAFAVFLVGPQESEWVVPTRQVLNWYRLRDLVTEGAHGFLEIVAGCDDGQPRFRFLVDPELSETVKQRILSKRDALQQRARPSSDSFPADAEDPS